MTAIIVDLTPGVHVVMVADTAVAVVAVENVLIIADLVVTDLVVVVDLDTLKVVLRMLIQMRTRIRVVNHSIQRI